MSRIAIDLDGVCYEFERTARYMLREYRGCTGLTQESEHWDWIKHRTSDADWRWLWAEGVERGLFRYGHCVVGSIIGLMKLSEKHDLLAVTHRPQAAVPDTLAWLAYNKVPWAEVHILTHEEPKSTIAADVLIDDKAENVLDWAEDGRSAILFDQPWNRGLVASPRIQRVFGWKGVMSCFPTA